MRGKKKDRNREPKRETKREREEKKLLPSHAHAQLLFKLKNLVQFINNTVRF